MSGFINVPAAQVQSEFFRILKANGFDEIKAKACAEVFTANSVDGIYSHGVNRFPEFISMVRGGSVNPRAEAICKTSLGNIEQWDGQLGPGL